ncbi:TPA: hypothetical protein ACQZB3_000538 [Escherichia coli]
MSTLRVDNLEAIDGSKTVKVSEILDSTSTEISDIALPGGILRFGNTSGIPTVNISDDVDQRILLSKDVTNPNDLTVLQINRNANYEGGTAGYVGSALLVNTTVKTASKTKNYEWAGLFIMNNYAPDASTGTADSATPQQVSLYGQSNKYSTSATWAGCLEINDYNGVSANGAAIGLEVTVRSTGADTTTLSRVGMHISAHTPSTSDAAEWGTAYFATTDASKNVRFRHVLRAEGIVGDSVLYNVASTNQASAALIRDAGSLTMGIDLSSATYSSGAAIRVKNGNKISFDGQDTNYLMGSTSNGIICPGILTLKSSFQIISSPSTVLAGAAFSTTSDGFIIFELDGVQKKIPYF